MRGVGIAWESCLPCTSCRGRRRGDDGQGCWRGWGASMLRQVGRNRWVGERDGEGRRRGGSRGRLERRLCGVSEDYGGSGGIWCRWLTYRIRNHTLPTSRESILEADIAELCILLASCLSTWSRSQYISLAHRAPAVESSGMHPRGHIHVVRSRSQTRPLDVLHPGSSQRSGRG